MAETEPPKKKGRPKKNHSLSAANPTNLTSANISEDDFVFPLFSENNFVPPKTKINVQNHKNKHLVSPHILDLKNKYTNEKVKQQKELPAVLPITPDDYSTHYQPLPKDLSFYTEQTNFQSPNEPTPVSSAINFHKPPKHKNKNKIKLNLGRHYLYQEIENPASWLVFLNSFKIFKILKKIFSLIWLIISAPFIALDFLVDRSLKSIWWLCRTCLIAIINLFILTFVNFKKVIIFIFKPPFLAHRITNHASLYKTKKRNLKPFFSFLIVCLVIVLPLKIITLKNKASLIKGQVLGESLAGFEALKKASSLSQDFNFANAGQEFQKAYLNFSLAQSYLNNFDVFSQQIVKLAPEGKTAENLLIIGQLAAKTGQDFSNLINQLNPQTQISGNLITKLSLIKDTLNNIEPNFLELQKRVVELDLEALSKYVDQNTLNKISVFQSALPAVEENFNKLKNLVNFLMDFLGANQTKNYLFVFQNNNEIRPTGGFMGSFALIEINHGNIQKIEVPGGGFYDLKAGTQISIEAPKPFQLFSPTWQIWNANWFPDWPTSAKKIAWFYEKSLNGSTLDGVISLTPDVLIDLLKITGPIEMTEYKKTITAENFVRELQESVELEYDKTENKPKKIIGDLLPKILEKIFNLKQKDAAPFLSSLFQNATQKNILIWLNNDNQEQTVKNFSWAGEIKNPPQDFLMIVHTNIGGGKTDLVIKNKINHQIQVKNNGQIIDTLTLTRTHEGDPEDVFEKQNNVDYVRFYVPAGSQLISATGFDTIPSNLFKTPDNPDIIKDETLTAIEKNPVIDENSNTRITEEFGKTVFGNWLMVKPGQEKTVSLTYQLPFDLNANQPSKKWWEKIISFFGYKSNVSKPVSTYSLFIQKQPGVNNTDFQSQFNLSTNLQINNLTGKNTPKENGQSVTYQDDLKTDGYYEINLQ